MYRFLLLASLTKLRYYFRQSAENAIRYISGTKLDDRIIRTDWDIGFVEGRQYGRGKSGGQVSHSLDLYLTFLCFFAWFIIRGFPEQILR